MREIKFRAFLDTGEMVRVHGIQFVKHSPRPEPEIIDEHNDIHLLDEVVLMQYTGLKDKNGVEIYDGDIVEASAYHGKVDTKIGDKLETPFVRVNYLVKWGDVLGRLGWKLKSINFEEKGGFNRVYGDWYRCVPSLRDRAKWLARYNFIVIGNIHQHPELLDG